MATFYPILSKVLDVEGGYQAMPEDRGNYNSLRQLVGTNHGINAQVYENWIGRPPSVDDMRAMPQSTAIQIYRRRYWEPIQGDAIHDQHVAEIIFDGRVNHGSWGVKMLQRVLRIEDDGIVGPQTLAAIKRADPGQLYYRYKEARIDFYHWLAENREGQSRFLRGWLNRMATFTATFHRSPAGVPITPVVATAATWLPITLITVLGIIFLRP